jgi:signal transduction histidine kinase
VGNSLEAVIAFLIIRYLNQTAVPLVQTRYVFIFVLGAVTGCLLAATVGMLSLYFGGFAGADSMPRIWWTWWLGDMAGILIITPFILAWWYRELHRHAGTRREVILYLAMLLMILAVIFLEHGRDGAAAEPLAFVLFPLLMWAAYRYGITVACTSILLVSVFAAIATASGHGPFIQETLNESLLLLQTFMAVTVISTLVLAVAMHERHNFEQRLREASKRAEEATQAKSRFLSRMSHELRTPLNAVLGFSQLMETEQESLTESQKEYLEHILAGGRHVLTLINDILDLSKIEANQFKLTIEPTNLHDCVVSSIDMIHPQANECNVTIEYDSSQCKNVVVLADGVRLRQVLLNLLSNAIKYNTPGGRVSLHCNTDNDDIRLTIVDTGIGIAEDDMEELFEPFSRLYLDRTIEGTGIGLNITRHLVTMMHGQLGVASQPGKGSSFWFTLPKQ